jgi:hypothetical protein
MHSSKSNSKDNLILSARGNPTLLVQRKKTQGVPHNHGAVYPISLQ